MHRTGHVGAALLAYAPIGFVTAGSGFGRLALVGALIAAGLSSLPDVDEFLPFVAHRGPTHTVWFALLVGIAGGVLGATASPPGDPPRTVWLAAFGFAVGLVTIGSHLAADVLTPMGIRPFVPIGDGHYTFDLTRSKSPAANAAFLVIGVVAIAIALVLGVAIGNPA